MSDAVSNSGRSSSSCSSSDEPTDYYFWSDKRMTRHEVKLVKKHFSVASTGRVVEPTAIELIEPRRTKDDLPLPPWDFIESSIKNTIARDWDCAVTRIIFLVRGADTAEKIVSKALERNWAILYLGPLDEIEDFDQAVLPFTGNGGCSSLLMTEDQLRSKRKRKREKKIIPTC